MRSSKIKVLNNNVHAGDTNLVRSKDYNNLQDDVAALYTGTIDSTTRDAIRGYKVYTALLTQVGGNAPVATIIENTIGNIVWSRNNTGMYYATLLNAFPQTKTFLNSGPPYNDLDSRVFIWSSVDYVTLKSTRIGSDGDGGFQGIPSDGYLTNQPVEIRVYS